MTEGYNCRVLVIFFADMLRANKFLTSDNRGKHNALEKTLRELGGTFHSNCITLAPDTPRSLGVLWSGKSPKNNGMDTRHKYPGHEIKADDDKLFSHLIERGIPLNIVHESILQANLIFPPSVKNYANFYPDVASLIKSRNAFPWKADPDEVIFVVSNTYHREVTQRFAHKSSHDAACVLLAQEIAEAVSGLELSPGDHLVVFSDHGCKLSNDKFGPLEQLNRDRSQVFLFHSRLDGARFIIEDKLSDMIDMHNFFKGLFSFRAESLDDLSLGQIGTSRSNKAVVVEDHKTYATKPGEPITNWAVYTKNFEYFESSGSSPKMNFLTEPKTSSERLSLIEEAKNHLRARGSGYLALEKSRSLLSKELLSIPAAKISAYEKLSSGRESTRSWRKTRLRTVLFLVLTFPISVIRRFVFLWEKAIQATRVKKIPGSGHATVSSE